MPLKLLWIIIAMVGARSAAMAFNRVVDADLDGRILLLNRTGEEILGYRFADLRGKKLQELNEDFWLQ